MTTMASRLDLLTSLSSWGERGSTYTTANLNDFVTLSTAAINRRLAHYRREATATIAITAGVGSQPADFREMISVTYSSHYPPLRQVPFSALAELNPGAISGNPSAYAISGTQINTAPLLATGNLAATYVTKVADLVADADTNWLLDEAPDAYFWMIRAQAAGFDEDWETARGFETKSNDILDEISGQGMRAVLARSRLVLRGPTP